MGEACSVAAGSVRPGPGLLVYGSGAGGSLKVGPCCGESGAPAECGGTGIGAVRGLAPRVNFPDLYCRKVCFKLILDVQSFSSDELLDLEEK